MITILLDFSPPPRRALSPWGRLRRICKMLLGRNRDEITLKQLIFKLSLIIMDKEEKDNKKETTPLIVLGDYNVINGDYVCGDKYEDHRGNGDGCHKTEAAATAIKTAVRKMTPGTLPPDLSTPRALELLGKLVDGGMLDKQYQPCKGISRRKQGIIVQELTDKLVLFNQWMTFSILWNVNSETLRKACDHGYEKEGTSDFIKEVRGLLE